jgi:membrane associated rhomboid family serine protease
VAAHFRVTKVVMVLVALNAVSLVATSIRPALEVDGAQIPAEIARGQVYRLFTAMFVHADVSHLVLNMAALLIMGPLVEEALGPVRFLALYLLAGLGGFVVSFLFGPVLGASVGSSGAIFGVCGAWFSLARVRRRGDTAAIALLIALLLGYSFYDTSIDWRAHVGGLATGILVGFGCAWAARRPARGRVAWEAALTVASLAVLATAVVTRSAQIRG